MQVNLSMMHETAGATAAEFPERAKTEKAAPDFSDAAFRVHSASAALAARAIGHAFDVTCFADCVMSIPRRSRLNRISTAITTATVPATIAIDVA